MCQRRPLREGPVIERIAAMGAGRMTVEEVVAHANAFLASDHVVRLTPDRAGQRSEPQWSTVAHRRLEDAVLSRLWVMVEREGTAVAKDRIEAAIAAEGHLGPDQADAVRALCGPGPVVRTLMGPAGFGKTAAVHAAASASGAEGRAVLGVATTNQAVSELASVGIPAKTIARLALDLQKRPLPVGTTVILDEVSQTSTEDALVVLDAVATTPGAQLWCLGDPRQSPPVRAGGLAAELEALGLDGAIPAPSLRTNRRQQDRTDQAALAAFRSGEVAESQAMRTQAGWEHELDNPAATREAMAEAVVSDISRHGADQVMALAVSHVDCEDLADRIRARLGKQGRLVGSSLTGPGWAGPRTYTTGDRVLLHASVRRGKSRVHNNTMGLVTEVSDAGLSVVTDEGQEIYLPKSFLEGRRSDGSPKLSHAWCRTIDGAQGGTFEQVHLLGSRALSHPSGYVGQSRSRRPTHTWYVTALVEQDYGGRLADDRSGAEAVAHAMERRPLSTFAAADDPNILDRQIKAELAAHRSVLAARPADLSTELAKAEERLAETQSESEGAQLRASYAKRQLESHSALARLRREGREQHSYRLGQVERMTGEHHQATKELERCREEVAELKAAEARRVAFDAKEGWREVKVAELQERLGQHWAEVTLAVARQGDPLAYGIDHLREARATISADLRRLEAGIPPDRSEEVLQAQLELCRARKSQTQARQRMDEADQDLAQASERRWGRIDRAARDAALANQRSAQSALARSDTRVDEATSELSQETARQDEREEALAATHGRREELTQALADLEDALEDSISERVLKLARGEHFSLELMERLGPLPERPGSKAVWCAVAAEVERFHDRHPGRNLAEPVDRWLHPELYEDETRLNDLLERAPELLAVGDQVCIGTDPLGHLSKPGWAAELERAEALAPRLPEPALDHGMGMDLGW